MSDVLNRALWNLQVTIEESGAVITHDDLPVVQADASQLTRLMQNLIANAIKFRGEQSPKIHMGVQAEEDDGVFNSRQCIGIAPQHCERVFKIFQRLHGREVYSGSGIGLAVCQKTVARHGGRIWVESALGKGSTFFFSLSKC